MVLPPVSEKKFTDGYSGLKIVVTGAGGFIGSHLAKRLKAEGHWVRAVDWKENEYMKEDEFCNEFLNLDLRFIDACKQAVAGMDWCFNLAVRVATACTCGPTARHPACDPYTNGPADSACSPLGACRRTWAAWVSSSPTTRASCTTRR